jgi:enamine deaminase RidA (YjgF/YER057c/UK114 family)
VGQIAPDAAACEEPVETQIRSVLTDLDHALAVRKLGLEDLLRLRLFVEDLHDLPSIERAMDSLGLEWPAVSIIELPTGSGERQRQGQGQRQRQGQGQGQRQRAQEGKREHQRVAVTLDAVAAPGAREQRRLSSSTATDHGSDDGRSLARTHDPGDPVPEVRIGHPSVRFGPWVLVGATVAPAARRTSTRRIGARDSRLRRIRAESHALFAHLEELLGVHGAGLGEVVKVGGWLTFPMRDYGPLGDVRDALLARAGLLPASAAVQIGRVQPDALLAFEAIAFAPEDHAERDSASVGSQLPAPSRLAPFYADARSADGYVFTCGEVPTDAATAEIQACEAYERLRAHLADHGASAADVVQQTVFLRRPREDRAAVARAARVFFGAQTPPTTLLAAADLGFHPGVDVEIELVAATRQPVGGRCSMIHHS